MGSSSERQLVQSKQIPLVLLQVQPKLCKGEKEAKKMEWGILNKMPPTT